MLYQENTCNPLECGYTYKLYLNEPNWTVKVFVKNKFLGEKTFRMTHTPICGIDVADWNTANKLIDDLLTEYERK